MEISNRNVTIRTKCQESLHIQNPWPDFSKQQTIKGFSSVWFWYALWGLGVGWLCTGSEDTETVAPQCVSACVASGPLPIQRPSRTEYTRGSGCPWGGEGTERGVARGSPWPPLHACLHACLAALPPPPATHKPTLSTSRFSLRTINQTAPPQLLNRTILYIYIYINSLNMSLTTTITTFVLLFLHLVLLFRWH